MSKPEPLVSFVVLNWNGLSDTKLCIESIKDQTYPHTELIIVDNGSTDGSKDYFRELEGIKFVDLEQNTGFTGGHIAGREQAKGEFLAIINNDLVLDPDWTNACLETFDRHRDAAVVGGKNYQWNHDNPVGNTDNQFYSYQELDPQTGYTRTLLTGENECPVDAVSGAALMIKQSQLKAVGYFDDDFFAYYEENDLIARLTRAGYRAYYNPAAMAWHKIAASTKDNSDFYLYMMHRNRYLFAAKNLDDQYLPSFKRIYRRQVVRAFLNYVHNRKDNDALNRLRAWRWIRQNRELIARKRAQVQKLGGSFVPLLASYAPRDVTIIIPCYNYGQYVAEAIESAINQTVKPKQVIIINDGSTDNSQRVIDQYRRNPLVKIVHKANSGVIDTKNLGIKLSQTYWTVFLDADDKLYGTFLEDTLDMTSHGRRDIVYTDMLLFGAVNDIFRARPYQPYTLIRSNYINNSALIKTSLLKQVGGYKSEMKHGLEDWELYITLVEAGAKPQYLALPLVKYRQHPGAAGRNMSGLSRDDELNEQIRRLHPTFYSRHSYFKTIGLHTLKFGVYSIRYPKTILVVIVSTPQGIKRAVGYIYGRSLDYISSRIGSVE